MLLKKLSVSPGSKAVFLPIKPQFIDLILSGEKTVEYRKRPPVQPISLIILYSSSPIKKIVGLAEVTEVSCGKKDIIWKSTSKIGGISKKEYDNYFAGSEISCVIKIGKLLTLKTPLPPSSIIRGFHIRQGYVYVDTDVISKIYENGF
jgi:predicted transcriptional regulator